MPTIGTRELAMLLIGLGEGDELNQSLGGITRLQKYLYLLEKEGGVRVEGDAFHFEPYLAGPYSPKLYDDLEFLENLGLLESQVTGTATEDEAREVEKLSIDDLFYDPATDAGSTQGDEQSAFEERKFSLTPRGIAHVQRLLADKESAPVIDSVRKMKSRFANHSLSDLLHYVYTKYPEMTTASEIKDKVLKRGRSG
jgi:uncharacterized protein YwgA